MSDETDVNSTDDTGTPANAPAEHLRHWVRAVERAGWQAVEFGTRRLIPSPRVDEVPPGYVLDLPGRGRTFVVDAPGPTPDAPVLVLLHALVCTAYLSWGPAFGDLRDYRVIAFDQRWHGRGIRSEVFRLEDCADDVAAVLDELGIDEAIMIGYSMGGAIAQLAWQRQRERVAGLVLCSTAENFRGSTPERLFFPMLEVAAKPLAGIAARQIERVADRLPAVPSVNVTNPRTWAAIQFRSTSMWSVPEVLTEIGRFDSTDWVSEVDVPTAVVITTHDHAVGPKAQRRLAEDITGAEVFEAAAGHAAQALAYPTWSPALLDGVAHVARAGAAARRATG